MDWIGALPTGCALAAECKSDLLPARPRCGLCELRQQYICTQRAAVPHQRIWFFSWQQRRTDQSGAGFFFTFLRIKAKSFFRSQPIAAKRNECLAVVAF